MDDSEYYAMMRRQYSHTDITKKTVKSQKKPETSETASKTQGTFTEWKNKYGHEDAEMFEERNKEE